MTECISIRKLEASDAPDLQRYAEDSRIAATCYVPHPYPPDGAQYFVASAVADFTSGRRFAFSVRVGESFAGVMTLNSVDVVQGTASLDYWIAVPFWNQGVGTAAARLAIEFAFREVGLSLINSGGLAKNLGSMRVLEKNGFSFVEMFIHGGESSKFCGEQVRRFELCRTDWQKRRVMEA